VTALAAYGGSIYVGRSDGGVDRLGRDLAIQAVLAKPGGARVSFIAASPYGVAWLSGPGGVVREAAAPGKPAPELLTIRAGDRTVSVQIAPTHAIRRLSWLAGRLAVSYDLGSTFYDTRGKPAEASTFMPPEAAESSGSSGLWVREQEDGTELALFARPYAVRQNAANQKAPLVSLFTAYQVGAWQWAKLGGFASNALDAFPDGELKITDEGRLAGDTKFLILSERVALAEDGIVAREPEAIAAVPIYDRNWAIARMPAATVPGDGLWFGASVSDVWWWNGKALIQQRRTDGTSAAWLPWTRKGTVPSAFLTDPNGAWVGTNFGLVFIAASGEQNSGFVRAPFGIEAAPTSDSNAKKLADAVFAWRFSDAERAGADGGAMISSIFSVLGVSLPQTAGELSKAGSPVTDELRFGDVIFDGGSAAFYLGNGITVEVKNGRVQNGDVWSHANATVRRFY
jgi:hypothetical protein